MTLRTRLGLVLVLTAVPMVVGLTWARKHLEEQSIRQSLVQFLRNNMDEVRRERCEREPETFPGPPSYDRRPPRRPPAGQPMGPEDVNDGRGPGPGPAGRRHRPPQDEGDRRGERRRPPPRGGPSGEQRLSYFAYYPDFTSANPAAFPFDARMRAALEGGEGVASAPYEADGREGLQVALRMDWTEGPCAIMVVRRPWPTESVLHRDLMRASILLVAGLLAAVLLAAGPVVARIRRLTSTVRTSAEKGYNRQVEPEGSDEITDLARAFNEAGAEIREQIDTVEERERTLREFVANTTHDVMIPLTVLQGHLADLRTRIDAGEVPDAGRVAEAADEAHYLGSLVQNLEAAAKLDAAATELQRLPLDLPKLVERVAGRHRPVARQRGISLEFAVPEGAMETTGDETLLEQAVSNLVHNAVRHNNEGGNVALTLESGEGGTFRIRIADDGPGIATEDLERVTDRSFRSDEARTRSPDGRGLGLHIARTVCDRHGFTLEFAALKPSGLEAVISGATGEATA